MHYYRYKNKCLLSLEAYTGLTPITEEEAAEGDGILYFLKKMPYLESRQQFCLSDSALLTSKKEGLDLLLKQPAEGPLLPDWLQERINMRGVSVINTEYPDWQQLLEAKHPDSWRINLAGLGDVGGSLLVGLRLLGGHSIDSIGIYDRDENKLHRWEYEINQINDFQQSRRPSVFPVAYEDIFNCDMFVFCIAARVPAIGEEATDVRMAQFEANAKIISEYAALAAEKGFRGIFAVVSDPVDLLCKAALVAGNEGSLKASGRGLSPEQIRGYGLGVMNARALYYAEKSTDLIHYKADGRAYGPHGEGLVIADSITNYNEEKSLILTERARAANLEVRKAGFKPYIAPALSSGALSILSTIRGEWHYSATYMGVVYMGAKNRLLPTGTEVEALQLPHQLIDRLNTTYDNLRSII